MSDLNALLDLKNELEERKEQLTPEQYEKEKEALADLRREIIESKRKLMPTK